MAETQTTTYYTLKEIATLRGWAEQKLRRFVRTSELGPMLPTNGKKGKGRAFSDTAVEMLAKHAAEFAPGRATAKAGKPKAAKKAKASRKPKVSKKPTPIKSVISVIEQPGGYVALAVPREGLGLKARVRELEEQIAVLVGIPAQLNAHVTDLLSVKGEVRALVTEIG